MSKISRLVKVISFFLVSLSLSFFSLLQAKLHAFYKRCFPVNLAGSDRGRRFLIIQLGQIGDFVLSQPFFSALKDYYSGEVYITVLTDSINKELASDDVHIDEIIVYNSKKYSRVKKEDTKSNLFSLKNKIFDASIWLRGDIRIFCWLVSNRIPMLSIARFPNPLRWTWLPLITKKPIKKEFKHFIESLDELDVKIKPSLFACGLNRTNTSIENKRKNVFIHITAGNELRRWPEENFSRLCEKLLEWNDNIFINLLGSKVDWAIAQRIKNNIYLSKYIDRIANICGNVAMTDLSELLATGDLFIGVDSGLMHIASASGIPIVALMGPQSPQLYRPWGKQNIRVIYKDYFCSPCWQFACLYARSGPGVCILAITPIEVFNEATFVLERKGT